MLNQAEALPLTPYWLVCGERVAGTVATYSWGFSRYLEVAHLYLETIYRGRGVAALALTALQRKATAEKKRGIKLRADWTNPKALAYYLRRGFWVRNWRDQIVCIRDIDEPFSYCWASSKELGVGFVTSDDKRVQLLKATRQSTHYIQLVSLSDAVDLNAYSTLVLLLALHKWPLLRSRQHYEDYLGSDAVAPEVLARKIEIWDSWAEKHGFKRW